MKTQYTSACKRSSYWGKNSTYNVANYSPY